MQKYNFPPNNHFVLVLIEQLMFSIEYGKKFYSPRPPSLDYEGLVTLKIFLHLIQMIDPSHIILYGKF